MNARRAFIVAAAAALLGAPRPAAAQKTWRIGYLALHPLGLPPQETAFDFINGLRELGYVEKQNVEIDFRNGGGRDEPGAESRAAWG